ncbi:MAG: tetraacyldisaccharide 4'-kinase, partial [Deltaproteobacteria bacterium]|nr:tetraacyldisaccharide 4'-kinase [Deltaproteobacteria bacterium]
RRDYDLLVLNQSVGFGNGQLLPAGPMRERRGALQRADALVLIESFGIEPSHGFPVLDIMRGKPVLRAQLEPSCLIRSESGNWHEAPLRLNGRRVAAVSGVANPAGFHAMINALGAKVLDRLVYPDHYVYGPSDWKKIVAFRGEAEMVITTEKDLVKLEHLAAPEYPLYALRLKVAMEAQDESQLLSLIIERINHARRARADSFEVEGGTISGSESRPA